MGVYKVTLFIIAISTFLGCENKNIPTIEIDQDIFLTTGFPEIEYPEDNEFTQERWELGKKLFYDNILSLDSSINCGSCHKASLAFSDDIAFSNGVKNRPGIRNSPTLANVAYHPYYTRDGGVPTLEMQALVPLQEHNEFDFNILKAGERLRQDSQYITQSYDAYGREPDYYVITRALANFQRSLISSNSRFDQYTFGNIQNALTKEEKAGMKLFYSAKTNCSLCHSDHNFTNYSFANNGLYENYEDNGRMRLTGEIDDKAKFKIPTLRNIEVTAPYMHDGSLKSLREVIEHYNQGGINHINKSDLIKPLGLTTIEKEELIAFLRSLTDNDFINNEKYKP